MLTLVILQKSAIQNCQAVCVCMCVHTYTYESANQSLLYTYNQSLYMKVCQSELIVQTYIV